MNGSFNEFVQKTNEKVLTEKEKKDLIKSLKLQRKYLNEAFNSFNPGARYLRVFDEWNLKEILSHLIAWDIVTIDTIKKVVERNLDDINYIRNDKEFNLDSITNYENYTWEELISVFEETGYLLLNSYEELNLNDFTLNLGSVESPFTLKDSIIADINHFSIHARQITEHPYSNYY